MIPTHNLGPNLNLTLTIGNETFVYLVDFWGIIAVLHLWKLGNEHIEWAPVRDPAKVLAERSCV